MLTAGLLKTSMGLFLNQLACGALLYLTRSSFIGVSNVDEVVLVPNALHGVNTVLKNFISKAGGCFYYLNMTYESISQTVLYTSKDFRYTASFGGHAIHYPVSNEKGRYHLLMERAS
ncbi:hypothetical protein EDD85DRAFT_959599 [Armillaria nabsnona]|nr:hypothetical protein EDD85DRAFT_959599 [Armillaria nabsnona]